MKWLALAIIFIYPAFLLQCSVAYADGKIAIVINAANGIDSLTKEEVINIFLGRYRQFSSGIMAQPIEHNEQNKKMLFYRKLLGKELAEINSYWARLIFSGKAKPPRQAKDFDELKNLIDDLPGAISYMDTDEITPKVKIAFILN